MGARKLPKGFADINMLFLLPTASWYLHSPYSSSANETITAFPARYLLRFLMAHSGNRKTIRH